MTASDDVKRMFANEQKRHRDATTRAIQSIADSIQMIQRFHEHGQHVAGDLRNMTNDVLRAFERATAFEALGEVAWITADEASAKKDEHHA